MKERGRIFAGLTRFLLALAMLPACWAATRVFIDALFRSVGLIGGLSIESLALLGGMAAFSLFWSFMPHPVKTYVLGHELTHVLWGLIFFARPSRLKVGENGGSVQLTRSNFLITLAPYFFPFYTFTVIIAALVTAYFIRPLPCLAAWMFGIGFTWAFHILFTFQTLTVRQPDIAQYGRLFSWTFIYIVNILIVLVWLCCTTRLAFSELGGFIIHRTIHAYASLVSLFLYAVRWAADSATA